MGNIINGEYVVFLEISHLLFDINILYSEQALSDVRKRYSPNFARNSAAKDS